MKLQLHWRLFLLTGGDQSSLETLSGPVGTIRLHSTELGNRNLILGEFTAKSATEGGGGERSSSSETDVIHTILDPRNAAESIAIISGQGRFS